MRIPLRHEGGLMPQKPLDFIQVDSALREPRSERMAQVMEPKMWNARTIASLAEFPAQEPHL